MSEQTGRIRTFKNLGRKDEEENRRRRNGVSYIYIPIRRIGCYLCTYIG